MCRLLQVNRAWYYGRQRVAKRRFQAEQTLQTAVAPIIQEFPRSGDRRVTKAVHHAGYQVNHKQVLRLLRHWQLLCKRRASIT